MLDATFLTIAIVALLVVTGTSALGAISAAPWVPLRHREARRLLTIAAVKPGERVIDLGAGDGRILAAAAREFGAIAVGYEVSVLPYLLGRLRLLGVRHATLHFGNFFRADWSQADVVVAFLTPMAMAKILPKLDRELKAGARFVTYAFPLPNVTPELVDKPSPKVTSVFLYRAPLTKS